MPRPLILVTGASGYIASRLIPRLLGKGYRVRALARRPEWLVARAWSQKVEFVRGDVTDSLSLESALEGVHTAYCSGGSGNHDCSVFAHRFLAPPPQRRFCSY